MPYETARLLAYQSYQHWISTELFSFGWFVTVGVLTVVYTVWLKLVDTSRIRDLLLLGTLSAMGLTIADMILFGYFGVAQYKISVTPVEPPIFTIAVTIAPILYMLVQQYTSSWKSYVLWAVIGTAVLNFGLLPIYALLGIFQLQHWNYFYHFLLILTDGMIARGILLWMIRLESQSVHGRVSSTVYGLQPVATKPLVSDKEDTADNDD